MTPLCVVLSGVKDLQCSQLLDTIISKPVADLVEHMHHSVLP